MKAAAVAVRAERKSVERRKVKERRHATQRA
jgi:hypothetical protein